MRPSMRGNLVSLVVDKLDTVNAFLVVYATVCVMNILPSDQSII